MRKMQLILFLTAIMLVGAFALPAYAQTTISGSLTFDPNNTNGIASATGLTVTVLGPNNVEAKATVNADGTFSIPVAGAGTYSFKVTPSKLDYVNKTTNATYSILYPDGVVNNFIKIVPAEGMANVAIPASHVAYPAISGTVPFDANNYNNVTSVTQLTVYAINQSGFETKTNPNADGTFSMVVTGSGPYSFRVIPSKLDYLNKTTNVTYSVQYPDATANNFTQNVPDEGLKGIAIQTWTIQTGTHVPSITVPASTATAQPTPGFTLLAVLAALGATAALAYRKR